MNNELRNLIKEFYPFAKQQLGFSQPVKIILTQDKQNAKDPLGKTAYYNPEQSSITLFVVGRHIKDILRSFSHELVHHFQQCNGQMKDNQFNSQEGYFRKSKYMKELEREAFERGNMIFREWEENQKSKKSE